MDHYAESGNVVIHSRVPLKGSAHLLSNTTLVSDLAQWLNCPTGKSVLSTFMHDYDYLEF